MSLLANEFDVLGMLRGQVSLSAVNQIFVNYKASRLQKSKGSLKDCVENVNIMVCVTTPLPSVTKRQR